MSNLRLLGRAPSTVVFAVLQRVSPDLLRDEMG
jgi:hypothetical protein